MRKRWNRGGSKLENQGGRDQAAPKMASRVPDEGLPLSSALTPGAGSSPQAMDYVVACAIVPLGRDDGQARTLAGAFSKRPWPNSRKPRMPKRRDGNRLTVPYTESV